MQVSNLGCQLSMYMKAMHRAVSRMRKKWLNGDMQFT